MSNASTSTVSRWFTFSWVFRSSIAVLALLAGYFALAHSVGWPAPYPFSTFPDQSARDFAVLMVSYATLCVVRQRNRPWLVDLGVFVVSFGLWLAAVVVEALDDKSTVLSTVAVLVAVAAGILAPLFKGDDWIWRK